MLKLLLGNRPPCKKTVKKTKWASIVSLLQTTLRQTVLQFVCSFDDQDDTHTNDDKDGDGVGEGLCVCTRSRAV